MVFECTHTYKLLLLFPKDNKTGSWEIVELGEKEP